MEAALDRGVPLWEVTAAARRLTRERFGAAGGSGGGWRVRLYAPLYLSSHCANRCAYCGFQAGLPLPRTHLQPAAALAQARVLAERGFCHLLLVAGDFPRLVTVDYLAGIASSLVERGLQPAVEVAALSTGGYARLAAAGVRGVTLYMETYDEAAYESHHPRGPKVSFDWRLEALERAAEAGIGRLGLGVLLGLAEPEPDLRALAAHAGMLSRRFPAARLSFSLPRLHAAPAGFEIPRPVPDDTFVRFMAALRLGFPGAEIVLSTREAPELRERLAGICVTQLSAGSSTVPGGYDAAGGDNLDADGQFPVADERAPSETAAWLGDLGHRISWRLEEAGRAPEGSRR
jgi:2-iminoacetate synthase